MPDIRQMAEELLTLGAVRDAINTEYKRRHAALQAQYEELGLERQRIMLPDGTDFGMAVLAAAPVTVEIADREAMLEWLDKYRPSELVETKVYDIRLSYWRVLADAARKSGVGVDPWTGERLDWIRVTTGERTLRATPTYDAKQMVKRLLNTKQLRLELEE